MPIVRPTVSHGNVQASVVSADDLEIDDGTLSIDATNNRVGVGTTSPAKTLSVDGDMHFQPTAISTAHITTAGSLDIRADQNIKIGTDGADSVRLGRVNTTAVKVHLRSGTDTDMVLFNSQLGLGTETPGTQLQLESTAPYVTLKNSTAENTAGGCESKIIFEDHDNNALGQIEVSHAGSSDDTKGQLILSTSTGSALTAALTISETQKVTIPGEVDLGGATSFDSAVADEGVSGITATFTAGEALSRGEVVYFKASDSKMWKAVATAAATSRCVAMAAADISADTAGLFLMQGFCHDNGTFPAYTVGGALYTPEAETSGENVPEQTAPDTDGDFVQVIGWAVTANMVYFNPSNDIIEIA